MKHVIVTGIIKLPGIENPRVEHAVNHREEPIIRFYDGPRLLAEAPDPRVFQVMTEEEYECIKDQYNI